MPTVRRRHLNELYTSMGKRNAVRYILRAARILGPDGTAVARQVKNHKEHLAAAIKKAKSARGWDPLKP